jgi:hypothetical protein
MMKCCTSSNERDAKRISSAFSATLLLFGNKNKIIEKKSRWCEPSDVYFLGPPDFFNETKTKTKKKAVEAVADRKSCGTIVVTSPASGGWFAT